MPNGAKKQYSARRQQHSNYVAMNELKKETQMFIFTIKNQTKPIIIILVVIKTIFPAKLNTLQATITRSEKSAVNQLVLRRKHTHFKKKQPRHVKPKGEKISISHTIMTKPPEKIVF